MHTLTRPVKHTCIGIHTLGSHTHLHGLAYAEFQSVHTHTHTRTYDQTISYGRLILCTHTHTHPHTKRLEGFRTLKIECLFNACCLCIAEFEKSQSPHLYTCEHIKGVNIQRVLSNLALYVSSSHFFLLCSPFLWI